MFGTVARNPTRCDLASFCSEISEGPSVFVINYETAIRTKFAYFSSMKSPFEAALSIIISAVSPTIRHFCPLDSLLIHPPFPGLSPL